MTSLDETGRCVMCGLCLPHCPTYLKTRDESESPRGRISLMRALHEQQLPAGRGLNAHLDNCLECRACETVCPAQVPFGALMDEARRTLLPRRARRVRWGLGLAGAILGRRRLMTAVAPIARIYRTSGLRSLLVHGRLTAPLPALRRLAALVPRAVRPDSAASPIASGTPTGTVALFRGCVAGLADADTLAACRVLLERFGYRVEEPPRQTCCGALHQHAGDREHARRLISQNATAFDHPEYAAVVSAASACGLQLAEASPLLGGEAGRRLSGRHRDINTFLAEQPWPPGLTLSPLAARVAVHTPCSHRNGLGGQEHVIELLGRIPGIDLVDLQDNHLCCGAAGTYMLTHPAMADALATDKIRALRRSAATILVTTNVGCRMHLQGALERHGMDTEVLHPATLLARQIVEPGFASPPAVD